ncbi:MAG: DUF4982 domain-containing protein [Mediterraneibacter faecis]
MQAGHGTGYEGETASVDVYANADEVELFLNGESLGRKSIGGVYVVTYEVPYHPGKLEAVSYLNGAEARSDCLTDSRESGEA